MRYLDLRRLAAEVGPGYHRAGGRARPLLCGRGPLGVGDGALAGSDLRRACGGELVLEPAPRAKAVLEARLRDLAEQVALGVAAAEAFQAGKARGKKGHDFFVLAVAVGAGGFGGMGGMPGMAGIE